MKSLSIIEFTDMMHTELHIVLELLAENEVPYIEVDGFVRIPDMDLYKAEAIQCAIALKEMKKGIYYKHPVLKGLIK